MISKGNINKFWPILEAMKAGKTVQYLNLKNEWEDRDELGLIFDKGPEYYRIKPSAPDWFQPGKYVKISGSQPIKIISVVGEDIVVKDNGDRTHWKNCTPMEFRAYNLGELSSMIPFAVRKVNNGKFTTVLGIDVIGKENCLYIAGNGAAAISADCLARDYRHPDCSPCGKFEDVIPF